MALREKLQMNEGSLLMFLKPKYFDMVILCTKDLGGFSYQTNEGENVACFTTPSLPLKIGYSVEKCYVLAKGIGIKTNNSELISDSENFLELYKLEWAPKISTVCLKTMDVNKFNKIMLLPLTEDIMKVRNYLKRKIPDLTSQVAELPTLENWRALAEAMGIRLTIFNRRRGNEAFQLLISRYNDKNKWKEAEMDEIKKSLSPLEKRLMRR